MTAHFQSYDHPFKYNHLSPVQKQIFSLLPESALPHEGISTAQQAGGIQTPRDLEVKWPRLRAVKYLLKMTSSASSSLLMRVARNTTSPVLGKSMGPIFHRSLAFLVPSMFFLSIWLHSFIDKRQCFLIHASLFPLSFFLARLNAASTFSTSLCARDALGVKFSPPLRNTTNSMLMSLKYMVKVMV
jgi:hypothetical protein